MKPYAESSEVNKVPILAVLKEIFADRKQVLEIASGTGQHAVHFGRELPHLTWQPSELPQHLAGIQAWLDEAQLSNVLPPLALDVNDAHWDVNDTSWPFYKSIRPEPDGTTSHPTDITTSHSTRMSKDNIQVAGYKQPQDGCQVVGYVEGDALQETVRPEVSKGEGHPISTSPDAIFNANTVHIISWPEVERMFAHIARVIAPGGYVCLYGPFNYNGNFTSESNARFDAWLKSRDPNSGVRDFEEVNRLAASHGMVLLRDIAMPSNNRILVWEAKGSNN